MKINNVLIFPAGTEIGLEIYASLKDCKDIRLFGAGVDSNNHASFIYEKYFLIPHVTNDFWLDKLIDLCITYNIDYIFPGHDDAIIALTKNRHKISATVLSPDFETCQITRSKIATYHKLSNAIRVPNIFEFADDYKKFTFPLFIKPDIGQGSQGVALVNNKDELAAEIRKISSPVICEYLPGEEYTVDCFSDREHGLLFAGARIRNRIRNGIAVNTSTILLDAAVNIAKRIQIELNLYGAWFFQLKKDASGRLTLLEVAPRIAGSMAIHRVLGINFALLTIYESKRIPLKLLLNDYQLELDRALSNKYKSTITYSSIYVDLDDTLIINEKLNINLISLIYESINNKKRIHLITRHSQNLSLTLKNYRINNLFDSVHHLLNGEKKSKFISDLNPIFIDDSFSEREEVKSSLNIPTFDCSMIEMLINSK